jgi:deleted-in-malignant-brain-tumors protein 1
MNNGNILMDDVYCTGEEWDLWGCSYTSDHNCGHTEDVGVTCAEGFTIENGNFRMILDPATEYQYWEDGTASGRIEYYNGYEWGTVCDDYFDQNNDGATVFCNSMGLPSSQASSYRNTQGSGAINMDDVNCYGDESDLTWCSWTSSHNCGHSEDVSVVCAGKTGADAFEYIES